jgi:hypothetical protein
MHLGQIEFNIVLFTDWSFASGCSPPRFSTTQLPSATDRPVFPSGRDFHPSVGAYSQAHFCSPFGAASNGLKGHESIAQALAWVTFFIANRPEGAAEIVALCLRDECLDKLAEEP